MSNIIIHQRRSNTMQSCKNKSAIIKDLLEYAIHVHTSIFFKSVEASVSKIPMETKKTLYLRDQ